MTSIIEKITKDDDEKSNLVQSYSEPMTVEDWYRVKDEKHLRVANRSESV